MSLAQLVRLWILEPYARRRRRRIAIRQLTALDDRLLADIGLNRNQIALAVDGNLTPPWRWPVATSQAASRGTAARAATGCLAAGADSVFGLSAPVRRGLRMAVTENGLTTANNGKEH